MPNGDIMDQMILNLLIQQGAMPTNILLPESSIGSTVNFKITANQ